MTIYNEILFDYQKEASQRIYEQRSVLLADQPGLGKTLEVIGALELDGLLDKPSNILILTPIINAQTTWRDSIERFVKPRYNAGIIDASKGTAKQKSKQFQQVFADGPVFVIANHDAIAMTKNGVRVTELVNTPFDAVIIDESHLVLPINDPRKLTQFWKGLSIVRMNEHAIRVAVSGTPDRGKLENRYGTWKFLHPKHVAGKWSWLEENFFVIERKVSRTRTIKDTAGLKDKQAWLERDKQWMIRRTKAEVLPQLPPKRYIDVEIDLHDDQRAQYFSQQQRSAELIYNAKVEERNSAEAMVYALRARQIADCVWHESEGEVLPIVGGGSAKLEWLLEWLGERGFLEQDDMADNSAQVVIVSQFSKVLHWLREELSARGIESAVLDGSASDSARNSIQREFQNGILRIVLLSGSMGVGINLDAADDLIMFDSPYDPDRIEQIEDRVHRASSNHQVNIWNLIALDTIDQAIAEKVNKRYKTTRSLMDGSRGVDFARKVLEIVK
jgi:SNF2 family DNA or RNA helicase